MFPLCARSGLSFSREQDALRARPGHPLSGAWILCAAAVVHVLAMEFPGWKFPCNSHASHGIGPLSVVDSALEQGGLISHDLPPAYWPCEVEDDVFDGMNGKQFDEKLRVKLLDGLKAERVK